MWNFRRCYKQLSFSYMFCHRYNFDCIDIGKTHVEKLMKGANFRPVTENLKHPCRYNHKNLFFYSTSLNDSSPDDPLVRLTGFRGENGCESGEDCEVDGVDDDDGIEVGERGTEDEKFSGNVGVVLDILRGLGIGSKTGSGGRADDKPEVISGAEVTNRLNQCGVVITSELVAEVLSRTRNDWEAAFTFFLWTGKQPGYVHSVREYHSMISILAKRRKFDTAWSLINEMREGDVVNANTLWIMIRRYCAAHDVTAAINTFHAFKRFGFPLGIEEFHKLLSALSRYKNVQNAERLLFSNKNTFPFNTKSFNIILNGWCNVIGSPREAGRFWRVMIDQGIELDVVSYSSMISSYSKLNRLKEVLRLFDKMKETGIDPDRKVYNTVIYVLANCDHVNEALNLLVTMERKGIAANAVTYNSLIRPLCKARKRDEAHKVFDEMLTRGLHPTIRTLHAFLQIQRTGEEIYLWLEKMEELGCCLNKDTYLLLVRKFCRWGQLDEVFKLWDQMTQKGWNDDKASYVTLIHGLFLNGKLDEAHKIYLEMKERSLLPDAKTNELIQIWLSNKLMAE